MRPATTSSLSAESCANTPRLDVCDFYRNAVVLITGASGFMGKVLVEKLLLCFAVKKIYVLLREKRNVSPSERFKQMVEDPIFDTIRGTFLHHAALFAKLEAVDVDFKVDEFVKEPCKTVLLNNVQIVFHVMGSVSFANSLQDSLEDNARAAERLYNFLRRARTLQAIVHVSTFYSNCNQSHIEELIYDDVPFGGMDNVRQILSPLSESERAALTPTILGPLPNTYVFSKKCAEVMVQRQYAELPIGVFRPPIVGPSYREPAPSWVDCLQGLCGLSIPVLKQRLVWYVGDGSAPSALAPVDYCIAGMITAACDIRVRYVEGRMLQSFYNTAPSVPVYNFHFDKNPVTWQQCITLAGLGLPTAIGRLLSPVRVRFTACRLLSRITFWLLYLQAFIVDFCLGLAGKPKRHAKTISSLDRLCDVSEFFRCRTWTARNDNVQRMRLLLAHDAERLLEFDVDRIDWKDYYTHFTAGLFLYLERREKRKRDRTATDC